MEKSKINLEPLRKWFLAERRPLPWRGDSSPYAVWVSEVMLQQTQVAVVIPYFERWMKLFPTITALAEAPLEQVIKAWEGLGYYSRARNLHTGAQQLVEWYGGELPKEETDLSKIKGIGPYTLGAIRSFAFKQRSAAVDGNVLRVISRYEAIEADIGHPNTKKQVEAKVLELLPEKAPWEVMEGLIELGALVCTKNPSCKECPLQKTCKAYRLGEVERFPIKAKKQTTIPLYRAVAVIRAENRYLVNRGSKGKVMAGLCEFPYWEMGASSGWDEKEIIRGIEQKYDLQVRLEKQGKQVTHGFTKYRATLTPFFFEVEGDAKEYEGEWKTEEELRRLPFSAGHKRILNSLLER